MNFEKNGHFTVINDQGETVTCDVLLTFDVDVTGKHYVLYTDKTLNENGNINVYAATYEYENNNLNSIETEEEWALIESTFKPFEVASKIWAKFSALIRSIFHFFKRPEIQSEFLTSK